MGHYHYTPELLLELRTHLMCVAFTRASDCLFHDYALDLMPDSTNSRSICRGQEDFTQKEVTMTVP